MTHAKIHAPTGQNALLSALPADVRETLLPRFETVTIPFNQVIVRPDAPFRRVVFPLTLIGSVLTVMANGEAIEVGTVGNEGMIGMPVALGAKSAPQEVICQMAGQALVIEVDGFRQAMEEFPAFAQIVHRYIQAFFNLVAQSARCNRLHDIDERCARWLLMTHDRAGSDTFSLTHEFLAQMLGVRRATVSVTAAALQRAGLISYTCGQVTIVDRRGLEGASCECYQIVRDEFDRLVE